MLSALKRALLAASRRLPLPLARPIARWRWQRMQRRPEMLAGARRQMEFLVGAADGPPVEPHRLDELAHRFIEQVVWRRELRWRPEVITRQQVSGVENLVRGRAPGMGLVLAYLHHGRFEGIFGALHAAGAPEMFTVGNTLMFGDDIPPHLRANLKVGSTGSTPVSVGLGFAGLSEIVARGDILAMAVDSPGSTRVRFLGRDLLCASGVSAIAFENRCPVVVALPRRVDDVFQDIAISEPLFPADHPDAASLAQAIFDTVAPSVLAWPEAYDWPRRMFTLLDAEGRPVEHVPDPGEPAV